VTSASFDSFLPECLHSCDERITVSTDHDLDANIVTRVNVGDMLTRAAWRRPEHEAVIDGARRLSYRALNDEVNRLCHALLAAG
jgi:non-ribosomal peptide synthetase component F